VNLNQLRVFYVAARERSHTRAARLLFITQPAVSQNIKALETFLGSLSSARPADSANSLRRG
jgi:DNA-binding transcriptional LysR family regulator